MLTDQGKALTFAEEYIWDVLDGDKTATVRYDDAEHIKVDDTVSAITGAASEFATLDIKRTATLNAVEALGFIELVGAEYGADTAEELIDGVGRHYNEYIGPGTTVRVIVFEAEGSTDGE